MEILDYFADSRQAHWKQQIGCADWSAAGFLVSLLQDASKFADYLGADGKVYLLVDGERIVSFATLSRKDCIRDDGLYPWIGFVYTFPAYRGHRYSERLIHSMEDIARTHGCSAVYLATDQDDLYEKFGFTYWESRVDRWNEISKVYFKKL